MKIRSSLSSAILLASFALGASGAAWAHATLQSAAPAKDAVVTGAPKEITLRFNEKLEAAFSTVRVVDGAGKAVTAEKAVLDAADPSVMRLAVPALAPGRYTVQFTVVGRDGHRRKGDYVFTVK